MKKYNSCLLALMVSVFLLLCACAQQQSSQASSDPDTLSSIPATRYPPPIYTPASSVPTTSAPATSVPATSAPATTPSTAPTQPTTMSDHWLTLPSMQWVTDREIVPFENRFKEDVPFGHEPKDWIVPDIEYSFSDYIVFYPWGLSIAFDNGCEREFVYNIPIDPKLSAGFSWLAADGRWGYWLSNNELCKLDLLTGELTTLDVKNEGDIRWEVKALSKDTVCIFRLDAQRNLRIYYRDLHSESEKTLYEGVLPDVPTSENELFFYAPTTTQGDVYWEMINPAFYEIYLKELNTPGSDSKDSAAHRLAIQGRYSTPMLVRYSCDFNTGALTADFGWYDTCWKTKDCKHDHFNYENTREEVPTLLDVAPVEIPNFSKLTGESLREDAEYTYAYIYNGFGYGYPYVSINHPTWKLADIPVIEIECSWEYAYCVTLEGTIVQLDFRGSICNTIYSSENELRDLFYWGDCIYFVDGSTIICIDEAAGTWRPILQTTFDELTLFWSKRNGDTWTFTVRQGMYYQDYSYNPLTGELNAI